uniref:WAP domain-containing protein n=1 Tax=Steinernema glaseri TaxID=37863 RepID=A0A1I8A9X7_9BILA
MERRERNASVQHTATPYVDVIVKFLTKSDRGARDALKCVLRKHINATSPFCLPECNPMCMHRTQEVMAPVPGNFQRPPSGAFPDHTVQAVPTSVVKIVIEPGLQRSDCSDHCQKKCGMSCGSANNCNAQCGSICLPVCLENALPEPAHHDIPETPMLDAPQWEISCAPPCMPHCSTNCLRDHNVCVVDCLDSCKSACKHGPSSPVRCEIQCVYNCQNSCVLPKKLSCQSQCEQQCTAISSNSGNCPDNCAMHCGTTR